MLSIMRNYEFGIRQAKLDSAVCRLVTKVKHTHPNNCYAAPPYLSFRPERAKRAKRRNLVRKAKPKQGNSLRLLDFARNDNGCRLRVV